MNVSITVDGPVATVTIDNPPVNALGHSVRQGLIEAAERIDADPGVAATILRCAGRTFVAGADIREFGMPPQEPHLPDVLMRIETAAKPWVAAIHGTALGGGLELAMACHARVAAATAQLGLPEVTLGLIPGAGGTVRLPRLAGADLALDMITGGKPVLAETARRAGLVDTVTEGDVVAAAVELAKAIAADGTIRRTLDLPARPPADHAAFEARSVELLKKSRGQTAPAVAVAQLRAALSRHPTTALASEREAFLALRAGPQAKALRHIFLAERAASHVDRLAGIASRPLDHIGVIGGGTMGAGIASACLLAGLPVVLVERDGAAAQAGADRVIATLDGAHKRGLLTDAALGKARAAFSTSTDYADLGPVDMVIEAVFEDMAVKQEVFRKLDTVTRPDAILATNTSYLDVNEIARSVADPSRVVGLHFFSPAHIMKLLEIVVTDAVADDVLTTALALARRLRKIAVLAGVCDGFIANRIMSAYRREADYMLEDGALPWQIDKAMTDFGMPMGIFQMQDLAGLDIAWAMRKRRAATRDPAERYVEIADRLCEMGRFGRKTGRGWYIYDGTLARPAPEVEALILAESARKGITRTALSNADIMRRILDVMHAEADRILAEGIARNADDIDVVMVNAYGFPRWLGGPMHMRQSAASD